MFQPPKKPILPPRGTFAPRGIVPKPPVAGPKTVAITGPKSTTVSHIITTEKVSSISSSSSSSSDTKKIEAKVDTVQKENLNKPLSKETEVISPTKIEKVPTVVTKGKRSASISSTSSAVETHVKRINIKEETQTKSQPTTKRTSSKIKEEQTFSPETPKTSKKSSNEKKSKNKETKDSKSKDTKKKEKKTDQKVKNINKKDYESDGSLDSGLFLFQSKKKKVLNKDNVYETEDDSSLVNYDDDISLKSLDEDEASMKLLDDDSLDEIKLEDTEKLKKDEKNKKLETKINKNVKNETSKDNEKKISDKKKKSSTKGKIVEEEEELEEELEEVAIDKRKNKKNTKSERKKGKVEESDVELEEAQQPEEEEVLFEHMEEEDNDNDLDYKPTNRKIKPVKSSRTSKPKLTPQTEEEKEKERLEKEKKKKEKAEANKLKKKEQREKKKAELNNSENKEDELEEVTTKSKSKKKQEKDLEKESLLKKKMLLSKLSSIKNNTKFTIDQLKTIYKLQFDTKVSSQITPLTNSSSSSTSHSTKIYNSHYYFPRSYGIVKDYIKNIVYVRLTQFGVQGIGFKNIDDKVVVSEVSQEYQQQYHRSNKVIKLTKDDEEVDKEDEEEANENIDGDEFLAEIPVKIGDVVLSVNNIDTRNKSYEFIINLLKLNPTALNVSDNQTDSNAPASTSIGGIGNEDLKRAEAKNAINLSSACIVFGRVSSENETNFSEIFSAKEKELEEARKLHQEREKKKKEEELLQKKLKQDQEENKLDENNKKKQLKGNKNKDEVQDEVVEGEVVEVDEDDEKDLVSYDDVEEEYHY